jgi:hypothetical protein
VGQHELQQAHSRIRQPLAAPAGLNQIWALDFMTDALYGGRAFRRLTKSQEIRESKCGIISLGSSCLEFREVEGVAGPVPEQQGRFAPALPGSKTEAIILIAARNASPPQPLLTL